jgi:prophage regulatory protein
MTDWDGLDFTKTARGQEQAHPKPAKRVPPPQFLGPCGRILRIKDVILMTGLSKSTIWKMHQEGRFPKRSNISPRSVGWLYTEIHGWINERFGNGDKIGCGLT